MQGDCSIVCQDYNVTCFKMPDVLIAVLGAYQELWLEGFFTHLPFLSALRLPSPNPVRRVADSIRSGITAA